jgi:hypothetical protein
MQKTTIPFFGFADRSLWHNLFQVIITYLLLISRNFFYVSWKTYICLFGFDDRDVWHNVFQAIITYSLYNLCIMKILRPAVRGAANF